MGTGILHCSRLATARKALMSVTTKDSLFSVHPGGISTLLLASFAKEESWSAHFFAQQGSAAKIWSGNWMEGGSSMSEPADMTQTTGLPHQLVPNGTRMPNESNQKPECKMHCWLPKSEISKGKSKPGHCREQFALLWRLATSCKTQRKPQAE